MEPKENSEKRRRPSGFGLLAVQSISCMVVILLLLIVRLIGGGVFGQLRTYFEEAMRQNSLTDAAHALWNDAMTYEVIVDPATTAGSQTTTETTATTSAAAGTTTAVSASTAVLPVSGAVISSGYGCRNNPLQDGTEFHSGVDLAAEEGKLIGAMWSGTVVKTDGAGETSLGRYLVLCHENGIEVTYAHCSEVYVEAGQQVVAGQTVAAVGHTGAASGPHLHLEMRQNGALCDPTAYLSAAQRV